MSRNGYEMDDEMRNDGPSEVDDSAHESPISPTPVAKPRAKKARASKAPAKTAGGKKNGTRKSVAPRASKAPVDLSKTITMSPGRNPTAKIAQAAHHAKASRHPDLISIPPADLNDHDERFFAEGEQLASQRGEHFEAFARLKAGHVSSPDLGDRARVSVVPPERRKKLANYVKATVAISAVLCLAAVARVGFSAIDHGRGGERSAAAAQIITRPAQAAQAPAPVALVDESQAGRDHTFAEQAAPAIPLKSAHEEREDARAALEHGKAKDAVDAATRSITVDPTDAEAWLLLGAAQQETGHPADAHASFLECTKQAKTGNVGECRAMLQWNGPR